MTVRTLSSHGWTTWTARNGAEALRLLERRRPDIVLLDLLMPEVDGFELMERMRQDPGLSDVRVVVYTAKALSSGERQALTGRSGRVLEKGAVSSHDLLRHLRRIYSEARRSRDGAPAPVGVLDGTA